MKLKPCKYCGSSDPVRNKCTLILYGLNKWLRCKCSFETRISKTWYEAEQDWNNGCGWIDPPHEMDERFEKMAVGGKLTRRFYKRCIKNTVRINKKGG